MLAKDQKPDAVDRALSISRALELRDLEVAVAVADHQAFRRAAESLDVEPSAISRRVRSLEDRLGASLFERSRSGVRLTRAGDQFIAEARDVLRRLNGAVGSVRAAGTATNGAVNIGVIAALGSRFLGQCLLDYRNERPAVRLTIAEGGSFEHMTAVKARTLDVAFVIGLPWPDGCEVETLWHEPLFAALPERDARASDKVLPLTVLADETFIVSSRPSGRETEEFLVRALSGFGRHPTIHRHDVGRETLLLLAGLGLGVGIACQAEVEIGYPQVSFVPLEGQSLPLSAIWLRENDNPALRRFLSVVRQRCREQRRAGASQTPDPSP